MKLKTRKTKAGFTLVEILVVVAIILSLAAVGFSLSAKATRAAKSAATIAVLREIGVAAGSWMSENNSFYPPCWDDTDGANRSYAQILDPYMHGVENYRELDSKFIGPNKRLKVEVNDSSHPVTFSMNQAVCRDITESDEGVAESLIHITEVDRPEDVILMADGCQNPGKLNQANLLRI